jgi:hypothetical protein
MSRTIGPAWIIHFSTTWTNFRLPFLIFSSFNSSLNGPSSVPMIMAAPPYSLALVIASMTFFCSANSRSTSSSFST